MNNFLKIEKDKENYAKLMELGSNIKNDNKIEERAQNNSNNKSEHQSYSKSNNPYTIGS